jgi:hypothetical protein
MEMDDDLNFWANGRQNQLEDNLHLHLFGEFYLFFFFSLNLKKNIIKVRFRHVFTTKLEGG